MEVEIKEWANTEKNEKNVYKKSIFVKKINKKPLTDVLF